jgi:hypothetical protein
MVAAHGEAKLLPSLPGLKKRKRKGHVSYNPLYRISPNYANTSH